MRKIRLPSEAHLIFILGNLKYDPLKVRHRYDPKGESYF